MKFFEGDLELVTSIQNRLFFDARDFAFFRKGEFDNVDQFISFVADVLKIALPIVVSLGLAATGQRRHRESSRKVNFAADRRVLTCASPDNYSKLDFLGEECGFAVGVLPESEKGRHRYFVTEREYCLFLRSAPNRFFGIRGSEKPMIMKLRELFLEETMLAGSVPTH